MCYLLLSVVSRCFKTVITFHLIFRQQPGQCRDDGPKCAPITRQLTDAQGIAWRISLEHRILALTHNSNELSEFYLLCKLFLCCDKMLLSSFSLSEGFEIDIDMYLRCLAKWKSRNKRESPRLEMIADCLEREKAGSRRRAVYDVKYWLRTYEWRECEPENE